MGVGGRVAGFVERGAGWSGWWWRYEGSGGRWGDDGIKGLPYPHPSLRATSELYSHGNEITDLLM